MKNLKSFYDSLLLEENQYRSKFVEKGSRDGILDNNLSEKLYLKSAIKDAHIENVIHYIAEQKNISKEEVLKSVEKDLKEKTIEYNTSPKLIATMYMNAVEQVVYKLLDDVAKPENSPKFKKNLFERMMEHLGIVYPEYRNITSGDDNEYGKLLSQADKKIIYVDADKNKEMAERRAKGESIPKTDSEIHRGVNTAAASGNGHFYFNVQFMQKLLDYAHLKRIIPTPPSEREASKMYKYYGGTIPDEYCYLEFIYAHEIEHFRYGDFSKKFRGLNHRTANITQDLRINHDLVKAGLKQLPLGLFSNKMNLDNVAEYPDIIALFNAVKEELKKFNKDEQPQSHDKHGKSDEQGEGEGEGQGQGEGQGEGQGQGQGEGEEQGEGEGQGQGQGEGEGEGQGKGKGKGKGQGQGKDDLSDEEKEVLEKANKRIQDAKKEIEQARKNENSKGSSSGSENFGGSKNGGGQQQSKSTEFTVRPAEIKWEQILERFVLAKKRTDETTWSRPGKSLNTGHVEGQEIAIRPGTRSVQQNVSISIILDASASMNVIRNDVLSNIKKLFDEHGSTISTTVLFTLFSNKYETYLLDSTAKTCSLVKNIQTMELDSSEPFEAIFDKDISGGTEFNESLREYIQSNMLEKKYNTMIFSDYDLTGGDNFDNVFHLLSNHADLTTLFLDTYGNYFNFLKSANLASMSNVSYVVGR